MSRPLKHVSARQKRGCDVPQSKQLDHPTQDDSKVSYYTIGVIESSPDDQSLIGIVIRNRWADQRGQFYSFPGRSSLLQELVSDLYALQHYLASKAGRWPRVSTIAQRRMGASCGRVNPTTTESTKPPARQPLTPESFPPPAPPPASHRTPPPQPVARNA